MVATAAWFDEFTVNTMPGAIISGHQKILFIVFYKVCKRVDQRLEATKSELTSF
jgi:hypothetical protein